MANSSAKAKKKKHTEPPRGPDAEKLDETELFRLQAELVKLQDVAGQQARIVVIFEGRDAAGKGSTIKRVAEYLNPRIARITALQAPTEREQTELVLPAVHRAPAVGLRYCAVRPQLVQPRRG